MIDKINQKIEFSFRLLKRSKILGYIYIRFWAFTYSSLADYHLKMAAMYIKIGQLIEKYTRR